MVHLIKSFTILTFCVLMISSCFGDRKAIDVHEVNDTSFVNKNFKGNKIDYTEDMNACEQLTKSALASLYNLSAEQVHILASTHEERLRSGATPGCNIKIMLGENDFNSLTGSISVLREVGKEERMGEIAEAAGQGKNWEEAWALKKSMYKSTEWVDGLGKAALWRGKKRLLEIKFDGYVLSIMAPGAPFIEKEKAKNRDYKKIAISIAKEAGYID